MRRTLIVLVLAVSAVAVVTANAVAAAAPIVSPIADPYYHDGGLKGTKGFGQVKPPVIFYGGDPTGLVCRIRWVSWGGAVAHGFGTGWYINSNQSVNEGHLAVAIVVASKLGSWHGRSAYDKLTWSFPDHGGQRLQTGCS
jgi:hypothetical protein